MLIQHWAAVISHLSGSEMKTVENHRPGRQRTIFLKTTICLKTVRLRIAARINEMTLQKQKHPNESLTFQRVQCSYKWTLYFVQFLRWVWGVAHTSRWRDRDSGRGRKLLYPLYHWLHHPATALVWVWFFLTGEPPLTLFKNEALITVGPIWVLYYNSYNSWYAYVYCFVWYLL